MRKKIALLFFTLTLFSLSMFVVKAATQTWDTSLKISAGSTATGTKRKHNNNNQSIDFSWTEIGYIGPSDPYMYVTLNKKGLLFYDEYLTQTLTVNKYDVTSGLDYLNSGSGNYYFFFSTQKPGNASVPTGQFKADPVIIKSYN